jgi:arylsulfatase
MDAHEPYRTAERYDRWADEELWESYRSTYDSVWQFYGHDRPWRHREAFEDLYDGAIRQLDHAVGRLVDTLADTGVLDDTLLIVTSDHGECFGEYSRLADSRLAEHGIGVHDALTSVPLVVRPPGGTDPKTVDRPATLTRLPAVVDEAVLGDGFDPDDFVPSAPPISSSIVEPEAVEPFLSEYDRPVSDLTGTAHAVYVDRGDRVVRHARWGDETVVGTVSDIASAAEESTVLDRRLTDLSEGPVVDDGELLDEIDQSTADRLADLGYL